MRISDWSSDVCSSDLGALEVRHNDEVGSTSALARLHEQRIVSRGDLPRHGVTHRHELDDIAGCELNLCRCAERAPDLDHVSIGVIDRSEERRIGKEWVSTCRSRWSPVREKKKN